MPVPIELSLLILYLHCINDFNICSETSRPTYSAPSLADDKGTYNYIGRLPQVSVWEAPTLSPRPHLSLDLLRIAASIGAPSGVAESLPVDSAPLGRPWEVVEEWVDSAIGAVAGSLGGKETRKFEKKTREEHRLVD